MQAVTIILLNNLIELNDIKISYIETYISAKIVSYLMSLTTDKHGFTQFAEAVSSGITISHIITHHLLRDK